MVFFVINFLKLENLSLEDNLCFFEQDLSYEFILFEHSSKIHMIKSVFLHSNNIEKCSYFYEIKKFWNNSSYKC